MCVVFFTASSGCFLPLDNVDNNYAKHTSQTRDVRVDKAPTVQTHTFIRYQIAIIRGNKSINYRESGELKEQSNYEEGVVYETCSVNYP